MAVGPFALVPRAQELPGHCLRCPRDTNLIQLSGDGIHGYGIVYLCTVCMGELADGMGYMSKAAHEQSNRTITGELNRVMDLVGVKQQQLDGALSNVNLVKERISNGVRDLVERSLADFLAADDRGADLAVPASAEPADEAVTVGAEPAGEPVPESAGTGTHLLDGILAVGPRTSAGSARPVPAVDGGSDTGGDVWEFVGESEPDEPGIQDGATAGGA